MDLSQLNMGQISATYYLSTTDNHNQEAASNNMRIVTFNARSVKNKYHLVVQQILETDADIAVITQTWLKDTGIDKAWLNQSEFRQSVTYYCRTDQVQRKVVALHLCTNINTEMTSHY